MTKQGGFAYDEPLDSELIDPDPDFRETLRLLNAGGAHTVSSCQGHAPGTQYEDVQEWMPPYITCETTPETEEKTVELLQAAGEDQWAEVRVSPGKVLAKFPLEWDWKRSVAFLRAKMPRRPA
jgi:hypothetical protein